MRKTFYERERDKYMIEEGRYTVKVSVKRRKGFDEIIMFDKEDGIFYCKAYYSNEEIARASKVLNEYIEDNQIKVNRKLLEEMKKQLGKLIDKGEE